MIPQAIFIIPVIFSLILSLATACPAAPMEKKMLKYIASDRFHKALTVRTCRYDKKFVVYLIDNFDQPIQLTPEVTTTHGELLRRILRSGRDDIVIKPLNTSLTRGLAMVINDLREGKCADAVISSTPGSNYTYRQIESLFPGHPGITPQTILSFRKKLLHLLSRIAFSGFPSAKWLAQTKVHTPKLMNDSRKVVFASALGKLGIPLLIPYGNKDSAYLSEDRTVNILSIVSTVRAYSALDQLGRRMPGFPYSPLSQGDEQAVYHITEMPDPGDPSQAHLDVNNDGHADFTFKREGKIAFRNQKGVIAFSPPLVSPSRFEMLKTRLRSGAKPRIKEEMVLTAAQYRQLHTLGAMWHDPPPNGGYIWLNAPHCDTPFFFNAVPWIRGLLRGTSLIPPNKVKELLTRKQPRCRPCIGILGFIGLS